MKKIYMCYGPMGRKLGIIELDVFEGDTKKIFHDHKEKIKKEKPGTVFIRLHKKK